MTAKSLRKKREPCFKCRLGTARLIDPPEDAEKWPGVPRWTCDFCGNWWIPSDAEMRELGLKVPRKRKGKPEYTLKGSA